MKHLLAACCALFTLTAQAGTERGFYVDLGWRTPARVKLALKRAERIVASDPDARVEVLVHGNDIRLFARKLTQQQPQVIEHGADLAADGKVRFRVCEHALEYKSLDLDDMPSYFGTVYYVPERIQQLRDRGYTDLWSAPSVLPREKLP